MTNEILNEKHQNFLTSVFTVFDIETSGLDPFKDEILEIAGLKMRGEEIIGRFEALIQPSRSIPAEAEKIHGLNEFFLLVNGRNVSEVLKEFLAFAGDSIIVGHNIKEFDWLFILNQTNKLSWPQPQNKLIDTLELSRQMLSIPFYNLTQVAKALGLEHKNAHRAMTDVEVNAKVFIELMKKFFQKVE